MAKAISINNKGDKMRDVYFIAATKTYVTRTGTFGITLARAKAARKDK